MIGRGKGKSWLRRMLLAFVCCWIASIVVSLFGNPEVRFWSQVVEDKSERAREASERDEGPVVFIGGGSSASFSIHPDVFSEEIDVPACNMGGSAGMGYRYLINLAFSEAKAGDYVILHMTPESLSDRESPTKALGIRIALRQGNLSFAKGGEIFDPSPIGYGDTLLALRPGLKFLGTITAKILAGRPPYTYSFNNYAEGVMTIPNGGPTKDVEGYSPTASLFNEGTAEILSEISEYAKARDIQVFYALAWECFRSEACPAMREEHEKYLALVESYMPVLRDENAGAHDRPEDFLDTGFHMTLEAGRLRSRELAKSLQRALKEGSDAR